MGAATTWNGLFRRGASTCWGCNHMHAHATCTCTCACACHALDGNAQVLAMMHRHFRVPPATANNTANANTDGGVDGGARTGSKSQQDTFDGYLYLTQLQQARLPRPCPTSPDLLGARPPSPGLAPHSKASSLLQGRLLCYLPLTTHCKRTAARPPSNATHYLLLTTGALLRDRIRALAAAALCPGQHYGYPLLAAQ